RIATMIKSGGVAFDGVLAAGGASLGTSLFDSDAQFETHLLARLSILSRCRFRIGSHRPTSYVSTLVEPASPAAAIHPRRTFLMRARLHAFESAAAVICYAACGRHHIREATNTVWQVKPSGLHGIVFPG